MAIKHLLAAFELSKFFEICFAQTLIFYRVWVVDFDFPNFELFKFKLSEFEFSELEFPNVSCRV